MSCLIDVLYKRKINVSFTVTRLTQADTRRISTAPPPTVTNPSITTDICPLTPQSPLDLLQGTPTDKRFILLQATPTDKWFILQGGMNITALRLSLLTGYPPQGCPRTDPRTPRGPMGPLRGLQLLTLSIILDTCKTLAWDMAAPPITPLLTFLRIRQRRLCLTMLLPCSGTAEMLQWIPIA